MISHHCDKILSFNQLRLQRRLSTLVTYPSLYFWLSSILLTPDIHWYITRFLCASKDSLQFRYQTMTDNVWRLESTTWHTRTVTKVSSAARFVKYPKQHYCVDSSTKRQLLTPSNTTALTLLRRDNCSPLATQFVNYLPKRWLLTKQDHLSRFVTSCNNPSLCKHICCHSTYSKVSRCWLSVTSSDSLLKYRLLAHSSHHLTFLFCKSTTRILEHLASSTELTSAYTKGSAPATTSFGRDEYLHLEPLRYSVSTFFTHHET